MQVQRDDMLGQRDVMLEQRDVMLDPCGDLPGFGFLIS